MGYTQETNQSGQVFGWGQQTHDPKYCPQGPVANRAPGSADDYPSPGTVQSTTPHNQEEAIYQDPPHGVSPYSITPSGISGFSVSILFFCVLLLSAEALQRPNPDACGVGGTRQHTSSSKFPSRVQAKLWGEETCAGRELAPNGFQVLLPLFPFLCWSVCGFHTPNLQAVSWGEGDDIKEGAGKEVPWDRARPQSPDILGIIRY